MSEYAAKKPFYKRWWFWIIVVIAVLSIMGASLGIASIIAVTEIKSEIASKDEHSNGEWYYYYHLEMKNDDSDWPESLIMNRRGDDAYESLEKCRNAFINDYPHAVGGCAKSCEIQPSSAYALRLYTCEDVVEF